MGRGPAASYVPGAFNRLELEYDTAAGSVKIRVNGVEQPLADPVIHSPGRTTVAGSRRHRPRHADLDNFLVKTLAPAAPAPAEDPAAARP